MRVSKTVLKYGTLLPDLPLLKYNDGRLLPNIFNGAMLESQEIKDLKFMASRLDRYTARDSTDSQDLRLNCKNKRYACNITADHFTMYGLDYKVNVAQLTAQYYVLKPEAGNAEHAVRSLADPEADRSDLTANYRLSVLAASVSVLQQSAPEPFRCSRPTAPHPPDLPSRTLLAYEFG